MQAAACAHLVPIPPTHCATQVTSCAPLFVEVKPDASYSAICSGDAAVCKGFQTSVSSGDLHLELSNTPQTSTPTSILVMLPAAQLSKVTDERGCLRWPVLIVCDHQGWHVQVHLATAAWYDPLLCRACQRHLKYRPDSTQSRCPADLSADPGQAMPHDNIRFMWDTQGAIWLQSPGSSITDKHVFGCECQGLHSSEFM